MALERWVRKVTSMPGEFSRPTLYQTELQAVVGAPEANYRMLVVFDNDDHGLKPGVYVQTNLTADGANELPNIRRGISQQVCLALMDNRTTLSARPITSSDDPIIDHDNAIEMQVAAQTSSGGIVYKVVRPATGYLGSTLSEAIKGRKHEDYSITLLSRFGSFLERIRQGKFAK